MKERRTGLRKRVDFPVTVLVQIHRSDPTGEGAPQLLPGRAFDLSNGGMGLILNQSISQDTECLLQFKLPDGQQTLKVSSKVRRCVSAGEGKGFRLGVSFDPSQREALAQIANHLSSTFVLF